MIRLSTRIITPLLLMGLLMFIAFSLTFYKIQLRDQAIAKSANDMTMEIEKTLELIVLTQQLKDGLLEYQKQPTFKIASAIELELKRMDVLSSSFGQFFTKPHGIRIYKNYGISWQRYRNQFQLNLKAIQSKDSVKISRSISILSLYASEMNAIQNDLITYSNKQHALLLTHNIDNEYLRNVLMVGLFCLILVFFVILHFFLKSTVVNPIKQLIKHTKNIQAGKKMEPYIQTGTAELDYLHQVFCDMTNQLLETNKDLEFISHAKSEFLANMSHEMRTPMHGILSFSHMGMMRLNTLSHKKIYHYFQRIDESGHRLLRLLNDLLDLSKLEAGKMEFKFNKTNLEGIIESCLGEQMVRMEDLHLTTAINSKEPGQVICDEVRIGQVITNLLSNAIKFSPKNEVIKINIESEPLTLVNSVTVDGIKLSISNNGVSIPKDEIESIFDKFVQSSTINSNAGGTGLGLSICQEIIKGHQGKIWAKSAVEGGAVFSFVIPVDAQSLTLNNPR